MASVADFGWPGTAFATCKGAIRQEANMSQQDSAASNLRPDTREDEDRKAEANRRAAKYSRAVEEVRWEWAELERITSEDSRRSLKLDRSILEERLCIIEGLLLEARERHGAAKDLLAASKAIMLKVFHDDIK
jgi:hypothetical protein